MIQIPTSKTKKTVRFSDIVTIHEVGNSEDHRSARNGLQELRDRERFKRRIQYTSLLLNNVLVDKLKKINVHS